MRDLLSDLSNYARPTNWRHICVRYGKWCQRSLWHQFAV